MIFSDAYNFGLVPGVFRLLFIIMKPVTMALRQILQNHEKLPTGAVLGLDDREDFGVVEIYHLKT